jgi:hypothetical protein
MAPLITLTTDFGIRDPYVAAMKGVIYGLCPGAQIIDLTHDIAPQNVLEAALFVAGSTPFFPPGTIHTVVVDPGVGTERKPLVARVGEQWYVCPDNGVLTLLGRRFDLLDARCISRREFMREEVSATFHGRDIFAPTAARLAAGADPADVGEPVLDLVTLAVPAPCEESEGLFIGEVIHVDHFGNAISNISRARLGGRPVTMVQAGRVRLDGICRTYGDVPPGQPVALFGSSDHLEVAVNGGNAARTLELELRTPVIVDVRTHT